MKLDMDLARDILLEVEKLPFDGQFHQIELAGHSEEEVTYHLFQLADDGLIVGKDLGSHDGKAYVAERLTPEGHRFVEAIRSATAWEKLKSVVTKYAGPLTIEALKAALPAIMKGL